MVHPMTAQSKGVFFIVAVLWGCSFAFNKTLLGAMSPFTFTFWNFFISGLFLLALALARRSRLSYRWREGVWLGVLLAGCEIFQMIGLNLSSSANTAFLTNLGMLFLPFVGWILFSHRVSARNSIALLFAAVGMYYLVGGVRGFGAGELVLLASASLMALYFLYLERFGAERGSHLLTLLVQQFFTTAAISALVILALHEPFTVGASLIIPLVGQVIAFTTIPYSLAQWVSARVDESVPAIYDGVVEPLVGGIVSWVVFAEPATGGNVVGGLLMVAAFAYAAIFSHHHFFRRSFRSFASFVTEA